MTRIIADTAYVLLKIAEMVEECEPGEKAGQVQQCQLAAVPHGPKKHKTIAETQVFYALL